MPLYTLTKEERLYGKKDIENLLARGRSGEVEPIKYRYVRNTGCERNRIMVSVPKRLFKRAVKRNLLKRRIRESYRLQKFILPESGGTDIIFIYGTKEVLPFDTVFGCIGKILNKINPNGQREA